LPSSILVLNQKSTIVFESFCFIQLHPMQGYLYEPRSDFPPKVFCVLTNLQYNWIADICQTTNNEDVEIRAQYHGIAVEISADNGLRVHSKNKLAELALRFRSDLVAAIE